MTPYEAWLYAAEWGSYMTNSDPGACMYGFTERFTVQSEDHRQDCLRWIRDRCEPQVRARPEDFEDDELEKLTDLRKALLAAPIG